MLKEMKVMQDSLDIANNELHILRQNKHNNSNTNNSNDAQNSSNNMIPINNSNSNDINSNLKPNLTSTGPLRLRHNNKSEAATSINMNNTNMNYSNYIEHSDLMDKKIEILIKEKRELLAKNLEETKEKMECAQKLLLSERENTTLKAKITKLTLEIERHDRKVNRLQTYNATSNSSTSDVHCNATSTTSLSHSVSERDK